MPGIRIIDHGKRVPAGTAHHANPTHVMFRKGLVSP